MPARPGKVMLLLHFHSCGKLKVGLCLHCMLSVHLFSSIEVDFIAL